MDRNFFQETVASPSCEHIDYGSPEFYLDLSNSFGDSSKIMEIAKGLKAQSPEKTLLSINHWISQNLTNNPDLAYSWRNFDSVMETKFTSGCADYALVFAALARACGIPTVFVKTMDVDWIHEFRKTGTCENWMGHVFLEVHWKRKWRLLDPEVLKLYEDYDPAMRILPGLRYAYDKGSDPFQLVLSLDFERWKKQTSDYFRNFDLAKLPVGAGKDLGAECAFIAASSPIHQAIEKRCESFSLPVRATFNWKFDKYLKEARGQHLFIVCIGDQLVLEPEYYDTHLPISYDRLMSNLSVGLSGIERKELSDGTKVTLLYAKDTFNMLKVIDKMTPWAES